MALSFKSLQPLNAVSPRASTAMKSPNRSLRLRNPIAQKTNAAAATGISGSVPGRTATLVLAAIVRVAVADAPFVVTDEGEKAHDNPAGSPVHPKDTA